MATAIAKVYIHICPKCGCKFPLLKEKLEGTGLHGMCADCWLRTQPRLPPWRGGTHTEEV